MEDVCEDIREGTVSGTGLLCCPPQGRPDCFQKGSIGGGHWLAGQKEKYRSPQVTTPRRGPKEDPAERLENSTGWRRDLCGGMGRGGALARDSSGVVTSCSAGDVSAGASRARVGEVELTQQLGRVLNLRLEVVIVWGGGRWLRAAVKAGILYETHTE